MFCRQCFMPEDETEELAVTCWRLALLEVMDIKKGQKQWEGHISYFNLKNLINNYPFFSYHLPILDFKNSNIYF